VLQGGLFDCAKLHRDVKPIQDPTERAHRPIHGLLKLTCAVGQDRHALVHAHSVRGQKLIQPNRSRRHLIVHISVEARLARAQHPRPAMRLTWRPCVRGGSQCFNHAESTATAWIGTGASSLAMAVATGAAATLPTTSAVRSNSAPTARTRRRSPVTEMESPIGNTSCRSSAAAVYGKCAAHLTCKYSSSGVIWVGSAATNRLNDAPGRSP